MFTLRNTLANTNKLSSTTSTFLQQPKRAKSRPHHSSIRECQVPKVHTPRSSLSFAPIAYLFPSLQFECKFHGTTQPASSAKINAVPLPVCCAKKLIKECEVLISSGVGPILSQQAARWSQLPALKTYSERARISSGIVDGFAKSYAMPTYHSDGAMNSTQAWMLLVISHECGPEGGGGPRPMP